MLVIPFNEPLGSHIKNYIEIGVKSFSGHPIAQGRSRKHPTSGRVETQHSIRAGLKASGHLPGCKQDRFLFYAWTLPVALPDAIKSTRHSAPFMVPFMALFMVPQRTFFMIFFMALHQIYRVSSCPDLLALPILVGTPCPNLTSHLQSWTRRLWNSTYFSKSYRKIKHRQRSSLSVQGDELS